MTTVAPRSYLDTFQNLELSPTAARAAWDAGVYQRRARNPRIGTDANGIPFDAGRWGSSANVSSFTRWYPLERLDAREPGADEDVMAASDHPDTAEDQALRAERADARAKGLEPERVPGWKPTTAEYATMFRREAQEYTDRKTREALKHKLTAYGSFTTSLAPEEREDRELLPVHYTDAQREYLKRVGPHPIFGVAGELPAWVRTVSFLRHCLAEIDLSKNAPAYEAETGAALPVFHDEPASARERAYAELVDASQGGK